MSFPARSVAIVRGFLTLGDMHSLNALVGSRVVIHFIGRDRTCVDFPVGKEDLVLQWLKQTGLKVLHLSEGGKDA